MDAGDPNGDPTEQQRENLYAAQKDWAEHVFRELEEEEVRQTGRPGESRKGAARRGGGGGREVTRQRLRLLSILLMCFGGFGLDGALWRLPGVQEMPAQVAARCWARRPGRRST